LRAARTAIPSGLVLAAVCAFPACRRQQTPESPGDQKPTAPIKTPARAAKAPAFPSATKLHHAAQEMALDGFQFDKKNLGWPYDAGRKSAADFLALLVENNYLTAADAAAVAEFAISNLSDSDPGETAFLRSASGVFPIVVVRKDGRIESFADSAAGDIFAPPPPREPAWLPGKLQGAVQ